MSKRRREKAILVTAEEAPFNDGKGDVKKTVLSGSEIDGGESLSFWHSPSDHFRVALAAEAQLQLLSFVSGCFSIPFMRGRELTKIGTGIRYESAGHGLNVLQTCHEIP